MSLLPLPFVPEFAQRYGVDEALMLAVVMELVGGYEGQVVISEQRLYGRLTHLNRQQQGQVLASVSSRGLVSIEPHQAGLIKVSAQLTDHVRPQGTASVGMAQTQASAVGRKPKPSMPMVDRRQRDDELSRIFAVKEAEQSLQIAMHGEWQPSVNILRMLTQNMQISEAFAMGLRDEFVVYYMDKERRESPGGWDARFLKWVKKEHVQQQSDSARSQQQSTSKAQHEEARFLAREKRRQLSAAVLDINNTDW
jgi:hypothetical protein